MKIIYPSKIVDLEAGVSWGHRNQARVPGFRNRNRVPFIVIRAGSPVLERMMESTADDLRIELHRLRRQKAALERKVVQLTQINDKLKGGVRCEPPSAAS